VTTHAISVGGFGELGEEHNVTLNCSYAFVFCIGPSCACCIVLCVLSSSVLVFTSLLFILSLSLCYL